jgi:hypothetical protein
MPGHGAAAKSRRRRRAWVAESDRRVSCLRWDCVTDREADAAVFGAIRTATDERILPVLCPIIAEYASTGTFIVEDPRYLWIRFSPCTSYLDTFTLKPLMQLIARNLVASIELEFSYLRQFDRQNLPWPEPSASSYDYDHAVLDARIFFTVRKSCTAYILWAGGWITITLDSDFLYMFYMADWRLEGQSPLVRMFPPKNITNLPDHFIYRLSIDERDNNSNPSSNPHSENGALSRPAVFYDVLRVQNNLFRLIRRPEF